MWSWHSLIYVLMSIISRDFRTRRLAEPRNSKTAIRWFSNAR